MLCGTDPFPELFRAKKYKIQQKFLTRQVDKSNPIQSNPIQSNLI